MQPKGHEDEKSGSKAKMQRAVLCDMTAMPVMSGSATMRRNRWFRLVLLWHTEGHKSSWCLYDTFLRESTKGRPMCNINLGRLKKIELLRVLLCRTHVNDAPQTQSHQAPHLVPGPSTQKCLFPSIKITYRFWQNVEYIFISVPWNPL